MDDFIKVGFNTSLNPVGRRIKGLRQDANLTQQEMAKHFGVTQSNYQRMEKNDKRIAITDLPVFCRVLRTTTDYLLHGIYFKLPYEKTK